MSNVLIIGAGGGIAQLVVGMLARHDKLTLTLYLRNAKRLRTPHRSGTRIIEGDALDYTSLKHAVVGQDIVYVNLAGDLETMLQNVVRAMKEEGVKRIILVSSIGIYDNPVRPVLQPYRKAADVVEGSGLDYTILRPTWFTDANEIDFETTRKGEPEKGSVISRKSLAQFIADIIVSPATFVRANLGISKPNS